MEMYLFHFSFGHAANAVRSKVCVSCLNAPEAAQVLVALFLPFCDETGIGDMFF
jgi:hypothetical protein